MQLRTAIAVLLLAAPQLAADRAFSMEPEPVAASWNTQDINFVYIGRTSFYSCDSLRSKVARVLREVGAREDLIVRVNGCMNQFVAESFMNVRIIASVPRVVGPGSGLTAEEKSRRELVARVRGESVSATAAGEAPATEADVTGQFPAAWERVRFTDRSRILDDGDCELLEQLARSVFPKLEINVVDDRNACIPGQVRPGQINLEVEVLKVLPTPDDPG
jgi:hypothetical protein